MPNDAAFKIKLVSGLSVQDIRYLCSHHSFCNSPSDHALEIPDNIKGNPQVWTAQSNERIIGFVVTWGEEAILHICEPHPHEQFNGHGVVTELLLQALEDAKANGCLKFVLHNVASKEAMDMMKEGFVFSRKRDSAGETRLEFYLDLYKKSAPTDSREAKGVGTGYA